MNEHYEIFKNILNAYKLITELRTISDIYIKEFSMFLSICLNDKIPLNYPFYEFDKIIKTIQNTKELNNMLKQIFNKTLIFKKIYDKTLENFIVNSMKKNFQHDSKCNLIKDVSIKFKMNFNTFEKITLSNLSELDDLIKFIKSKHDLNLNSIKLYKDKNEIIHNKKLIEYDIEDDDIITVIINHSS